MLSNSFRHEKAKAGKSCLNWPKMAKKIPKWLRISDSDQKKCSLPKSTLHHSVSEPDPSTCKHPALSCVIKGALPGRNKGCPQKISGICGRSKQRVFHGWDFQPRWMTTPPWDTGKQKSKKKLSKTLNLRTQTSHVTVVPGAGGPPAVGPWGWRWGPLPSGRRPAASCRRPRPLCSSSSARTSPPAAPPERAHPNVGFAVHF